MIVCYQMGKVGSRAVVEAVDCLHVHTLDPANWFSVWRRSGLAIHIRHAMKAKLRIRRAKIITCVRDPVARNLSAFAQNMDSGDFLNDYRHDIPLTWFDRELKRFAGVDVYAHPFSGGWQKIGNVLILKAEAPDAEKADALSRFLGRPVQVGRANVSADRKHAARHERLKATRLRADYLDRMYSSRYARHFYSPDEIAAFRDRWAR